MNIFFRTTCFRPPPIFRRVSVFPRLQTPQSVRFRSTYKRFGGQAQSPFAVLFRRNSVLHPLQSSRSVRYRSTYNRFGGQTQSPILTLFGRWSSRPTFYYEVAGIGGFVGGIYVYNLETVPVSGRRRFNIYSPAWERSMGELQYAQLMQEMRGSILPDYDPNVVRVKRVLTRLVEGLEKLEGEGHVTQGGDDAAVSAGAGKALDGWDVHVIANDEANAFVLPGNKVFVFTGILPICRDDAGIASVLGHEIAHNLAHHAAEKMSSSIISRAIGSLILIVPSIFNIQIPYEITRTVVDLGYDKPGSRRQESEADYIGLLLMARSCYDPQNAIEFWQRMRSANKVSPPQFLSTHPSDETRVTQLTEWMPRATSQYEASDCANTSRYVSDFFGRGSRG